MVVASGRWTTEEGETLIDIDTYEAEHGIQLAVS